MILGLTGSIGSGKSTVARYLKELAGALIIDADELVRRMQQPGERIYEEIVRVFGAEILHEDGTLNRAALGKIVFEDTEKLALLNGIVHPAVFEECQRLIEENQDQKLIVLEVPLLFEIEADRLTDKNMTVTLDDEVRFARLQKERGMTRLEAKKRLAVQMPQDEKVRRSQVIIDNSGTAEETRSEIERFLRDHKLL